MTTVKGDPALLSEPIRQVIASVRCLRQDIEIECIVRADNQQFNANDTTPKSGHKRLNLEAFVGTYGPLRTKKPFLAQTWNIPGPKGA